MVINRSRDGITREVGVAATCNDQIMTGNPPFISPKAGVLLKFNTRSPARFLRIIHLIGKSVPL